MLKWQNDFGRLTHT